MKTTGIKNEKGFSFIELILYVAIITIVLSAIIPFALTIITSAAKSNTQQEVFSQARFISEKIKYEIRNAVGINSVSTESISLATDDVSTDPTIISLTSGDVTIKKGSGSAVLINSDFVTITGLTFTNNTSVDNKTKNISFVLSLEDNLTSVRQEYKASTSIRSSLEVRSN